VSTYRAEILKLLARSEVAINAYGAAAELGLHHNTVANALDALQKEGFATQEGRGLRDSVPYRRTAKAVSAAEVLEVFDTNPQVIFEHLKKLFEAKYPGLLESMINASLISVELRVLQVAVAGKDAKSGPLWPQLGINQVTGSIVGTITKPSQTTIPVVSTIGTLVIGENKPGLPPGSIMGTVG